MKHSNVVLGLALALGVGTAMADGNAPKLLQGNWTGSSAISFSNTFGKAGAGDNSVFYANVGTRYFFLEGLNIGPRFEFWKATGNKATSLVGPSIQYYFSTQGPLAPWVMATYAFGLTKNTIEGRAEFEVGFDYFLNSAVAVGPYVSLQHDILGHGYRDRDNLSVGGSFSMFW